MAAADCVHMRGLLGKKVRLHALQRYTFGRDCTPTPFADRMMEKDVCWSWRCSLMLGNPGVELS